MTEWLVILAIILILFIIFKLGSFLWRFLGLAMAIFLIWVFKDDISNWFNQTVTQINADGVESVLPALVLGFQIRLASHISRINCQLPSN